MLPVSGSVPGCSQGPLTHVGGEEESSPGTAGWGCPRCWLPLVSAFQAGERGQLGGTNSQPTMPAPPHHSKPFSGPTEAGAEGWTKALDLFKGEDSSGLQWRRPKWGQAARERSPYTHLGVRAG